MIEHDRALPARARPRDLRRRARRRRPATTFGPGLPRDPAVDRRSTTTSPATCSRPTAAPADRAALRAELGYGADERGVRRRRSAARASAAALLRRVIDALPAARASACRGCGWSSSCGPRIDPGVAARRPRASRCAATSHEPHAPPRGLRRRGRPGRPDDGMELAAARRRSSTSRCATTSSRTSTCATGSTATAPAGAGLRPATPETIAGGDRRRARRRRRYRPTSSATAPRAPPR